MKWYKKYIYLLLKLFIRAFRIFVARFIFFLFLLINFLQVQILYWLIILFIKKDIILHVHFIFLQKPNKLSLRSLFINRKSFLSTLFHNIFLCYFLRLSFDFIKLFNILNTFGTLLELIRATITNLSIVRNNSFLLALLTSTRSSQFLVFPKSKFPLNYLIAFLTQIIQRSLVLHINKMLLEDYLESFFVLVLLSLISHLYLILN